MPLPPLEPSAYPDGCDHEALSQANTIRAHPLNSGRGVRKDRIPTAGLLTLVHDSECLIYGIHPRIEAVLIGAEVKAVSNPPSGGLPDTSRSQLTTLEP